MEKMASMYLIGLRIISVGNDCQVQHLGGLYEWTAQLLQSSSNMACPGISWAASNIWECNIPKTIIKEEHST